LLLLFFSIEQLTIKSFFVPLKSFLKVKKYNNNVSYDVKGGSTPSI